MFRRRRREEVAEPEVREDEASEDREPDDEETWDEPGDEESWDDAGDEAAPPAEAAEAAWGPWDATDDIPPLNRVDFGSLQIPVADGFEIQLNIADDQGPLIAVVREDSSLQVQAFAAPKSGGLWEDVRQEIIDRGGGGGRPRRGGRGPVRPGTARPGTGRSAAEPGSSRSVSWAWTGRAGSCAG